MPCCPDSPASTPAARALALVGYLAPLAGLLLAVTLAVWLSGCDALSEDEPRQRVIVESLLKADEVLPVVRLSRTARVGEAYTFETNAVSGAEVTLVREGDGAPDEVFRYAEPHGAPGRYAAEDSAAVVPGGRYRLLVVTLEGDTLRAATTVPTAFETLDGPRTFPYNPFGPAPTVRVSPSTYPGRTAIFQLAVEATGQLPDPDPVDLVPFRCALYQDDPEDFDLRDAARGTSPVLNEGSFEFLPDGSLEISVPWLAIAYYGEATLTASAIDDGLYDFLTTQALQFSPGTLSPGEIPNVASNVEGGVGLFGAYAQTRQVVTIERGAAPACDPDGG